MVGAAGARCAAVDFEDAAAVAALAGAFDVAVAADVLYDTTAAAAFPRAAAALDVGELWLAHTKRDARADALPTVLAALRGTFPAQAVVARVRNVAVHRLRRRGDA